MNHGSERYSNHYSCSNALELSVNKIVLLQWEFFPHLFLLYIDTETNDSRCKTCNVGCKWFYVYLFLNNYPKICK